MEKKLYSEISISEIAENALLSRRTFYRIFTSKEDILQQYFISICDEYLACFSKGKPYTFAEIVEIFFSFWEQRLDFIILLQKNHMFYFLLEEFNKVLPDLHNIFRGEKASYDNAIELQIALLASAGALWNILSEWVKLEKHPSPKEVSQIITKAVEINTHGY